MAKPGRSFNPLWTASAVFNLGDGVMGAAFPLMVASVTRDPVLVPGASVVGRLPWFLFARLSGALVDRMDRRRVMIRTDAFRAVVVGGLAALERGVGDAPPATDSRGSAWPGSQRGSIDRLGDATPGGAVGGLLAAGLGLRAPFYLAAIAWALMTMMTVPIVNNRSIAALQDGQNEVG